ncbi:hypothetical protein AAE478_000156 [Parahypoxylon ruwenzoriense]
MESSREPAPSAAALGQTATLGPRREEHGLVDAANRVLDRSGNVLVRVAVAHVA